MQFKQDEYLWVEKYRPQTLDDIIIPQALREKTHKWVKVDRTIPNLLLSSVTPGTGKTSLVNAIKNDLQADVLWINASKDNGIDVIRNEVTEFCGIKGRMNEDGINAQKIVVLDEFDMATGLNQGSLRGVIEDATHVRFIMTANNEDNILPAIRSRTIKLDFDSLMKEHSKEIGTQMYKRLIYICENENIQYEPKDLQTLILTLYPSMRDCIQELQNGSSSGTFVLDMKMINEGKLINTLLEGLKTKDYQKCRTVVSDLVNPKKFYTTMFKSIDLLVEPQSIPPFIVKLHSYMQTVGINPEISIMAFVADVITSQNIVFKY